MPHPLLESIDGIALILDGELRPLAVNARGAGAGMRADGTGELTQVLPLSDADLALLRQGVQQGRTVEVRAALRGDGGAAEILPLRWLATPMLSDGATHLLLTELAPTQQPLSRLASAGAAEELAKVILVVLDLDGRVHRINRAATELLGTSAAELVGRDWLEEVIPLRGRAQTRHTLEALRVDSSDAPFEHHETVLSRDGSEHTIAFSSAPLRAATGEVLGLFCWGRDITAELAAQAHLEEREGRYRELIIAAPQGLLVYRGARVLFCNPAAASVLGAQGPQDVLGASWWRFVTAESRPALELRAAEVLKGRAPRGRAEVLLKRWDGERFPAEFTERRALYGGEPAVLVAFADITERKHLEARARRATQTLALLGRCNGTLLLDLPLRARLVEVCAAIANDAAFPSVWIGVVEGYGADGLAGPVGPSAEPPVVDLAEALWAARGRLVTAPGQMRILDFDHADCHEWHRQAALAGFRAAAIVPIVDAGAIVGALCVFVTTLARLTTDEDALLGELAQALGVGLGSARAVLQRETAEVAARRKAAQHAAVAAMGVEALRGGAPSSLAELVCEQVAATLRCDLCAYATLESGAQSLRLVAARGPAAERIVIGAEVDDRQGNIVSTLQEGTPNLSSDADSEPGHLLPRCLPDRHDVEAISAAVSTADGPLGVLEVLGEKAGGPPRFSDDDAAFLQAAANILAVAMMRHQAETAARESRETLDRAQRLSQMGSWDLHLRSGMLFWSDELYRIYRRPNALGPGTGGPLQNLHPDDEARVDRCLRASLETGQPFTFEARILTDDGKERTVHVEGTTTLDAQGHPLRSIGAVLDITRRSRAEQRSRLLAAAVEQLGEMVVVTDTHGNIEYANPAFERATGYTVAEVIGRNVQFLRHGRVENTSHLASLWPTLRAGRTWEGRFLNQRKDGSAYEEENTISPVRDEDGSIAHFVAIKRDVTHELELERRLRQAAKMEAIGRLTGGIAHDFNNILTGILSCAFFLLEDLEEGDPRREDAREIHDATKRAAELTQQLLAFSRKQVLRPAIIDLVPAVTHMEKMIRRVIGEDVALTVDAAGELLVKVDAGQFQQVILNLVVNGRDAMPEGGQLRISLRTASLQAAQPSAVDELQPGDYVCLSVSDTGIGMDEATLLKAFDPFFTTKGVGEGTGLGLSQVYGIVRQSGGYIDVHSTLGQGTTFTVYFPSAEQTDDRVVDAPVRTASAGSETVLVVEDDDLVRRSLARILTSQGYHVLEASSPAEAKAICSDYADPIELLVTDVVLPEQSGKLLAAELRDQRPGMRTLFMSGHDADMLTRHGIFDPDMVLLQKPVSSGVLLLAVREVLDTARL